MYYLFLVLAVAFECGGTFCMKLSDGFSQLWPGIGCLVLYGCCFAAFSKALQGISLSVTYAHVRERPMSAPVSRSCPFATSAVLPHTPAFVQAVHPAVCSHWKQNMFVSI